VADIGLRPAIPSLPFYPSVAMGVCQEISYKHMGIFRVTLRVGEADGHTSETSPSYAT